MKHFIYVALAISSVAMFAANVAGTALLRSESKKNHLETKGFGKRAKYGLGGLAVGVVAQQDILVRVVAGIVSGKVLDTAV